MWESVSRAELEEVSQPCSILDVVSSKIEEISQSCFVLDVVKLKNGRNLAEKASFSSLQIDR